MLIYSFCRYSLCLSAKGVGRIYQALAGQSRTNLLVRLVMETNMKIIEKPRIQYIDFEGVGELQNIWQPN